MPDHEIYPPHPDSRTCHVGTYRRVLPVSLERMYENTLDWEHLPYVHAASFKAIQRIDAGSWGWRAETTSARGDVSIIELRLDWACRRWITRTLEGANAGSEIWTHAFSIEERRVDIVVDFFVPGVAVSARQKVGNAFAALYESLYDEDVAMMTERQRQLDARSETDQQAPVGDGRIALGPRTDLALPMQVEAGGRRYVVAEVDGELYAYSALCPHLLGPLHAATPEQGLVTCPWHGYQFDVTDGSCTSGHNCRLPVPPRVAQDDAGRVFLEVSSR